MKRWVSLFFADKYCEIEKGKKIRRTLDDLRVR